MDNIADILEQPVVVAADQPVEQSVEQPVAAAHDAEDAYLQKFSAIDIQGDLVEDLLESIAKQPNDQERLYVAIEALKQLHKKSRMQDDQLVEMNNYFGSRA